jgi:hypothetical protein
MPEATWYRNLEGSLLLVIRPRSAAPRAPSNVDTFYTFYTHRGAAGQRAPQGAPPPVQP